MSSTLHTLETGQLVSIRPPVNINIGCGRALSPTEEGWINCDLYPGPGVDKVFDACDLWPFDSESVAHIVTNHTLEHLVNYMGFFREAWRVLIPNGQLTIRVPYGWHQSAWWDFTHLRPWLQESFATLQPGFTHFTRNYQHEDMGFAFWVSNIVMILEAPFARLWRFPPLRPFVRCAGRHLLNVFKDILVEAVKTTKNDPHSAAFGGSHHPAVVPCSYGAMEHEYYGRSGAGLQFHKLLVFTTYPNGNAIAGH